MHPRKHSCGWTSAILVMTTVKRRREVMLGAVLLQQQRWSFEELLFIPKYFRKNHFIARTLYVHETFSTESYCS